MTGPVMPAEAIWPVVQFLGAVIVIGAVARVFFGFAR